MRKPRYVRWILLSEAVGALSALASRSGMKIYMTTVTKPPLSPPEWLFPVDWGILYALMGIGAARVEANTESKDRSRGLNLFAAQLIVNFFWSPIFFNTRQYGFALAWLILLWLLVLLMILSFRRTDKTASRLQIPYLLWLTFAVYLNWGVWRLNP